MKPDVSVVVPVYKNRERLEKCIESICCQTLSNIEILLVDDGNDGDIPLMLDAYAKADERVEVIHQENHGSGYAINRGIEKAMGRYIAEVDCDDYIDKHMYEDLLNNAEGCDVVKSSFSCVEGDKVIEFGLFDKKYQGKILCPRKADLQTQLDIIGACPSMWSALYRKDFLLKNKIWMRETAGAGFQDTAFTLKTKLLADTYKIVNHPYYNYTIDNPNSSIHNHNDLFSLANEYDEVERFMKEHRMNNWEVFSRIKFSGYVWFFNRLTDAEEKEQFMIRFIDEINHETYYRPFFSDSELAFIDGAMR